MKLKSAKNLVCLLFILLLAACGKKGPPVPPGIPELPPVTGFVYSIDGDFVRLTWEKPGGKGSSILKGYLVYRSKTDLVDESCKGCPVLYVRAAELRKGNEAFGEMIQKGHEYIYKIVAVSEHGTSSRDSELIRFRY